jgi:hypothetical protein
VLISALHITTDLDGEFLVLAAKGRLARPEPMALPQPLPALRRAEKPTAAAPDAERRHLTVMFCDLAESTALSTDSGIRDGRLKPLKCHQNPGRGHCISDFPENSDFNLSLSQTLSTSTRNGCSSIFASNMTSHCFCSAISKV